MTTKARKAVTEQYLSVAQAARQLSVHPSTIRRWIDLGRLRAFRLGDKRIALQPSDLAALITPRRSGSIAAAIASGPRAASPVRITVKQQRNGLKALAELERLSAEIRSRRGELTPESWALINEARDERTRELMHDVVE